MDPMKLLVERLFDKTVYSKEVNEAKQKVYAALQREYEKLRQDNPNEVETMGVLLSTYGTIEKAGKLACFTQEEIHSWYCKEGILTKTVFQKYFQRIRWGIYLLAASLVAFVTGITRIVIYGTIGNYLYSMLAMLVGVGCSWLLYRQSHLTYEENRYDCSTRELIERYYDRYAKKLLNTTYFVLAGSFLECYLFVTAITSLGMTPAEAFLSFFSSAVPFGLIACITIKNMFCKYAMDRQFDKETVQRFQKYYGKMVALSIGYWVLVLCAVWMLHNVVSTPLHLMIIALLVYFTLVISANLIVRKRVVFCNIAVNLKRAVALVLVSFLVLTYQVMQMNAFILQPYISTRIPIENERDPIAYEEETGVYTITTKKDTFRILQLTDIHLGGSAASTVKDYRALRACEELIRKTKPDFVVVTGDLSFPLGVMSFSFNNTVPIIEFANFMRNLNVPWAFTYGNHDTERVANGSVDEVKNTFQSLSFKTSGNLLYPYVQPDITGRNNQVIRICDAAGNLKQALILLDSNDYVSGVNDYDYIHDDQVEWYEEQIERLQKEAGQTVSSMLFFHMPLQQYKTAYELYESGSDRVTYFFGENKEKMIDKVCCSKYPSKLFDTAKKLGSTKAMFCGHDHYNNLSVEYEGIRLTYGMSIDYLAMPGIDQDIAQRGATLITLGEGSTYTIEQIPYGK